MKSILSQLHILHIENKFKITSLIKFKLGKDKTQVGGEKLKLGKKTQIEKTNKLKLGKKSSNLEKKNSGMKN